MVLSEKLKNDVINFLTKEVKPFLIYIFGSAAKGTLRNDSDIDIAFLSDENFSNYEIFMKAQELADIIKRDVDLIDLKKASTVFKAQIVGTGEKIYCIDDTRRMYFETYAFKDYALLNEERACILENIKRSGSVYGK